MAWWPFGKKKPEDAAREGEQPATPPAGEMPASAPTMLVPPEFQVGDAPPPPPGDPFAAAPAQGGDPFAAPPGGRDPFLQTMEDPSSPVRAMPATPAPDPFGAGGAPGDFAQTLGDPDAPAPGHDGLTMAAPPPSAGGFGGDPFAAPMAAAGDPFGGAMPPAPPPQAKRTAYMPNAPVRAAAAPAVPPSPAAPPAPAFHTMTVPVAPDPDLAPARASEPRAPLAEPSTEARATAPATGALPPGGPVGTVENAMQAAKTALSPEKRRLGRALLAGGPITHERLQEELDRSGKSGSVIGNALLRSNFPTEEELISLIVARIRVPKINVKNTKIPLETIRNVPADVARANRIMAVEKIGDILVCVSPETTEQALQAVRRATGCQVFPFQCDAEGFDEILGSYYDRLAQSGLGAAPSPLADAAPVAAAPVAAAPAGASSGTGPVAAIPADEGEDQFTRLYAGAGPIPAQEILL